MLNEKIIEAAVRDRTERPRLATAQRRLARRRLARFAAAWIASFAPWCGLLIFEGRMSAAGALLVLAAQAAALGGAGMLARRSDRNAAVAVLGACIAIGVSSIAAFARGGASGEVLAFVLLTLDVAAALFFAWGWLAELALLAATIFAWLLAIPWLAFRIPTHELFTAIVIGSLLSLGVAEGASRAFRATWSHRESEKRARAALLGALEEAQAARREAEAATRAKDEFLATLSHELRSPVQAVLNWTATLRHAAPDARVSARALEVIERSARAQARLIDDLLDVSRIVSGKLSLDVGPVDVRTVLRSVVDVVADAAAKKQVSLTVAATEDPVFVHADAARLHQVVENLVSNALKFTPRGGSVSVSASATQGEAEIRVEDTGIGIARDRLTRVFERFEQAGAERHGGLGLGLAIVREIVAAHGGKVEAASDGLGTGATFRVTLPASSPPSMALAEAGHGAKPRSPRV